MPRDTHREYRLGKLSVDAAAIAEATVAALAKGA